MNAQPRLFDDPPPKPIVITPEDVRPELMEWLEAARAAKDGCPWDAKRLRYVATVFPQMATWLPGEERDRLRAEFAALIAPWMPNVG